MRLWRPSVQEEVNEELAFHVAMRTRENVARGMEPEAARAAALERFGDIDGVVATCRRLGTEREREMHRTEYLSELRQDIVFSWRQLAKAPAFTAIAVLTLALGIGATTSIFSALYAVVLCPFPYANPDRVVGIAELWRGHRGNVAVGNYASWRDETRSFESMAAIQFSSFNFAEGDVPERVVGARVSHQFFLVFGVPAALGRTFTAEEDAPGNETVVVLSHRLWTRRFGADPRIVGQTVRMNGTPYAIIGVMPPRFDLTSDSEELWVPIAFTARRLAMHDEHSYSVVGRIKPGVTLAQAQADLDRVAASLRQRFPLDNAERGALATPLAELIIGVLRAAVRAVDPSLPLFNVATMPERMRASTSESRFYTMLLATLGVVGVLLAAVGIYGIIAYFVAQRSQEIGIRIALGATSSDVVRLSAWHGLRPVLAGVVVGSVAPGRRRGCFRACCAG
jgi:putative ABC transport system permease protein